MLHGKFNTKLCVSNYISEIDYNNTLFFICVLNLDDETLEASLQCHSVFEKSVLVVGKLLQKF